MTIGSRGGYFLNFYLLLLIWISLPIPPTQEQNIGAAIAEKKELAKFTLWEFGEMVRKKKKRKRPNETIRNNRNRKNRNDKRISVFRYLGDTGFRLEMFKKN